MSKIADDFAFPTRAGHLGMTYRQWLVGKALEGLLANEDARHIKTQMIASFAVELADAVISELENRVV